MGLIKSNKTVSKSKIYGEETFKVKLSLESEPLIKTNPKDIGLVLDRSGSMTGKPIEELKKGISHFVDVIDKSSDGIKNNVIGNGSKIGVASFSSSATVDQVLTNSAIGVKVAANNLTTSGSTNHAEAFKKGLELLTTGVNSEKVMVLFTDGQSNAGQEGYAEAERAKQNGITIYCIGFGNPQTIDIDSLNKWASSPASDHVLIAPTFQDIETMFDSIAETISGPRATDITMVDKISPCFEVISIDPPTKGVANIVDKNTVNWQLDSVGGKEKETVSFEFTVKHTGGCVGEKKVNESYAYSDKEGNVIVLPDPTILIVGNTVDVKEPCPIGLDVLADGCKDYITFDAGDIVIDGIGRILEVSTIIKDVCPNKQVALAVIVHEKDLLGKEHKRGMKTMLIPPHQGIECQDVRVECIKFVLPEALDETGSPTAMCNDRNFVVRVMANYIDTDYECCNGNN